SASMTVVPMGRARTPGRFYFTPARGGERETRLGAFALLAVVAIVGAVFFPHLLGEIVFYRDLNRWVLPARAFVRTALAGGDSLAWNPAEGLGVALASSPLYGLYYPPYLFTLAGSIP